MKKRTVVLGVVAAAVIGCGGWYVSQYGFKLVPEITLPWGYKIEVPAQITLPGGHTVTLLGEDAVSDSNVTVYVDSVAAITGQGGIGIADRFSGSVESQETKDIVFDTSRKLGELFVEEGDEVKTGDPLFSYDTEDMKQKIQEMTLDLEEMNNEYQSMQEQLQELLKAQAKAKPEEQAAYNIKVSQANNSISRQEYNITLKELEITQVQKNLENAVVTSEMDGMIKKVDKSKASSGSGDSYPGGYGQGDSNAFITILALGDYRIKGTASEMSIWSLSVGQPVLVRPRADETRLYHGVISKVDTEPASDTDNNNMYYYGEDSGETVSKYHFYIDLEEHMDLMLGQHVLVELDNGQTEEKEGLWLPTYYIASDEEGSFVWRCSEKGTIEKSYLEIGEVDEELFESQILSGLETTDYIAFPDDTVEEGARAVKPDEIGGMDDGGMNDGMIGGDPMNNIGF